MYFHFRAFLMPKYGQVYVLQRRLANYSYLGCDFTKPSGRLREKKKIFKKKDSQNKFKVCLQITQ